MTAGQLRNATLGNKKESIGADAPVYVRLPDGSFAEVVGYVLEGGRLILETVAEEGER